MELKTDIINQVMVYDFPIYWENIPTTEELKIIKKVIQGMAIAQMQSGGYKFKPQNYKIRVIDNIHGNGKNIQPSYSILVEKRVYLKKGEKENE